MTKGEEDGGRMGRKSIEGKKIGGKDDKKMGESLMRKGEKGK